MSIFNEKWTIGRLLMTKQHTVAKAYWKSTRQGVDGEKQVEKRRNRGGICGHIGSTMAYHRGPSRTHCNRLRVFQTAFNSHRCFNHPKLFEHGQMNTAHAKIP
ncbi:hypothetical protein VKT23_015072 [Stygiomarasmius scandens]|uniref:Uncharacterized protein n=1 Tax=Marasmiellus scandens TaxID=2682957 RepID=A0ABR1J1T3_9AGAR